MSKKGISLPINMLVILAVAVIVLLAVVAFFFSNVVKSGESVSLSTAWSNACTRVITTYGCSVDSVNSALDAGTFLVRYGNGTSPFDEICQIKLGTTDIATCISECGCKVTE
ncbi:MAG: hypothetical protein DRP08_02995 [Candidatus Aenigmatarchaeota archaeon]|nr:MAG: hypothetical protein DRP08_02995 [Candidatus Aenigmarchaeota archaeon]